MIETNNLKLFPLTHQQLLSYLLADGSLEIELHAEPVPRTIPHELLQPLQERIIPNVADTSKNYLYFTLWVIVLKTENKMVGDLCFKGEPNNDGEIEIGYGTYENFQRKGFMTEAVSGIIQWAKTQSSVKAIIAETDENNIASFRILEKNNFKKYKRLGTMIWWRLPLH